MAQYNIYRVEYTFRQPRHEDYIFIVNERVIADSEPHALKEGLRDSLVLAHLIKHSMKLVHWEVKQI